MLVEVYPVKLVCNAKVERGANSSAVDEKTRLRVVQIGRFISILFYHRQCTCMPICTHTPSGKMPPSGSDRRVQGLTMILFLTGQILNVCLLSIYCTLAT